MVTPAVGRQESGLLTRHGVEAVFHYAPLHYLLFIVRAKALLSKEELAARGFPQTHLRSTSRGVDYDRGFAGYVHLTLTNLPPILQGKLKSGFPHFEFRIPASYVDRLPFHLCRYNIAKSRNPKNGSSPSPEGPATGYYRDGKQIPTAETVCECEALLRANLGINMIEVLVPKRVDLPQDTELIFFSRADLELARDMISKLNPGWRCSLASMESYARKGLYVGQVEDFLRRAQQDPEWRGSGLEFDRF